MISQMKLSQKLVMLVALPVILLAVAAFFSFNRLAWLSAELSDMGTEDMPLATLAAEIDGNIMDEALEVQQMVLASSEMRTLVAAAAAAAAAGGDAGAGGEQGKLMQTLAGLKGRFVELSKVSHDAFAAAGELLDKAMDDRNPEVVSAYQNLKHQLNAADTAQDAYEQAALKLFDAAAQGRHDEVIAGDKTVVQMRQTAEEHIGKFLAGVKSLTARNVTQALAGAEQAKLVLVAVSLLGIVVSTILGFGVSRSVLAPIRYARAIAERVAQGDLSGDIKIGVRDEIGLMLSSLESMQVSLGSVVGEVRQGAESVASASAQIAQGNADLSSRTEQQASALEETSASMEQMGSTSSQNSNNTRQASQLAVTASEAASRGGQVVEEVVRTMNDISLSSQKIGDIIGVIDGIAFQTNILALNAAVEAARAGEQGRGFAVVAGEVRNLAQRSAEAAKEIKGLITASVERVGQGTQLVGQAGATMKDILQSIQRVREVVGEISSATAEQSAGLAQVVLAVSQMDQATQKNTALVEESAAAASSLRQQAEQLVQSVSVFRLKS